MMIFTKIKNAFLALKWGWKVVFWVFIIWVAVKGFFAVWGDVSFANPRVKKQSQQVSQLTYLIERSIYLSDSLQKKTKLDSSVISASQQVMLNLKRENDAFRQNAPCYTKHEEVTGSWPNRKKQEVWRLVTPCPATI